ncbi:MAG: serine dehydratase beta chain [Clostridium fessum]
MEKLPCSIFNDVLGPVMRGPSSSHVAGAARIASMIRQSLDAPVKKAIVDFDVNGALAASHTGHGTDMGFASGLLNMELDAPDVAQYEAIAKERGLEIEYRIA